LINKVHFQSFSVPINAKKISNSDLNRGKCFQQGSGKMIAVAKFLENQNLGFSAHRRRELVFILRTQSDRANNSLQNETFPSSLRLSRRKI
jgi:hypothetical protein